MSAAPVARQPTPLGGIFPRSDDEFSFDWNVRKRERGDAGAHPVAGCRIPGIRCLKPLGAFYLFPNVSGVGLPSEEFANRLLTNAGVACLPGTAFGEYGEGYIRLSFANSLDNIHAALERIERFVRGL